MVKILLDRGVKDIDQVVQKGGTSLYIAAQKGHVEIVNLLIDRGANVDQVVEVALKNRYLKAVKVLLAAGLNAEHCKPGLSAEVDLFQQDPLKYVLLNNKTPELRLRAIENLSKQEHLSLLKERFDSLIQVLKKKIDIKNGTYIEDKQTDSDAKFRKTVNQVGKFIDRVYGKTYIKQPTKQKVEKFTEKIIRDRSLPLNRGNHRVSSKS